MHARPKRLMMRLLVVGLAMFVLACSDDDVSPLASTTTGAYSLRTVNGATLPYTILSGPLAGTVMVEETLNLFHGGTFAGVRRTRSAANAPIQTVNTTGTWTVGLGNTLNFRINESGAIRVAVGDGMVLTITEEGTSMFYSK